MLYLSESLHPKRNLAKQQVFKFSHNFEDNFDLFYKRNIVLKHRKEVDFLVFDPRGGKLNQLFKIEQQEKTFLMITIITI